MAHEIFLKLDAVIGESIEENHVGWIVVDSFSSSITAPSSDNDDFYSGACEHSPVEISKHIDKSSTQLAIAACMRTRFAQAMIDICQVDVHHNVTVLRVVLTGVTCLSYNLSGENNSTDSISLKYEIIEWHYTSVDPYTHADQGLSIARWDTKANKGG